MTKVIKVNPQGWYSLQDIVTGRMFPWVSSFGSVRNIVAQDRKKKNLLRANINGTGRATKYHFKGEHIIKFVKAVEAGTVRL